MSYRIFNFTCIALLLSGFFGGCGASAGAASAGGKTVGGENVSGRGPEAAAARGDGSSERAGTVEGAAGVSTGENAASATVPQKTMSDEARFYYNQGVQAAASAQLPKALEFFDTAVSRDARAFEAYYNKGVAFERMGRESAAEKNYISAIGIRPDFTLAVSALSRLYLRRNQTGKALQVSRAGYEASDQDIMMICQYADTLVASQKYDDAISIAKQALRIDERSAAGMLRIARANLMMGRYELAESIFSQVEKIDPDISTTSFLRGLLALSKDQKRVAIKNFEAALELNPFHVEALNNLAVQYLLAGNYQDAIARLESAVEIAPSWGVLHLNMGNALRGAGRWMEARISLEKSMEFDPSLTGALFNLGVLFYSADELGGLDRVSRYKKAKEYFALYRQKQGSSLTDGDDSAKYLKDLDILIQREEVRVEREKEARRLAEERAAQRQSGGDGEEQESDEEWEDEAGDDGGWE